MQIIELLTEAKSELLKFIGDTDAGMALGKIIHNHARVNSNQTPTPVKTSSTIKFLKGPKWHQQMFAKSRIYILQGSDGWAALYRLKDQGYVTRAQVELAVSNDRGTRIDSDIINTVANAGEGSLPDLLEKEIGTIQKSYWIENFYTSRYSSDQLKVSKRTDQSPHTLTPRVTRPFKPLIGSSQFIKERVKILIPSMVVEIKREIRKSVRQGSLEPIENLDIIELFDALDALAEDRAFWIKSTKNRFPGGASIYHLWVEIIDKVLKKKKISTYSKENPVQEVAEVFKLARDKFRKELIKMFFTKPQSSI